MNISWKWLLEYVRFTGTLTEAVDALTALAAGRDTPAC